MPTKQKGVASGSAPVAQKKKKAAAADAEEREPFPFGELPEGARHVLIEQLVALGKMNDVANVARDIAAVSQVNKELRAMKPALLARLAALLEPEDGDEATPPWAGAPERLHHEKRFGMCEYTTWSMRPPPDRFEIEFCYSEECLEEVGVPMRVYAEVQRLRALGLATTKATEFYGVTKKDLAGIFVLMIPIDIGSVRNMHLRRLPDVVAAARRRYAGLVGEQELAAVVATRAARTADKNTKEKSEARRAKSDEVRGKEQNSRALRFLV
jgi:hypothetical protein